MSKVKTLNPRQLHVHPPALFQNNCPPPPPPPPKTIAGAPCPPRQLPVHPRPPKGIGRCTLPSPPPPLFLGFPEPFGDFSRPFLSLVGLVQAISELFWASPRPCLSFFGLFPDHFLDLLGFSQTLTLNSRPYIPTSSRFSFFVLVTPSL